MLYITDRLLYFNFGIFRILTACHLHKFSCLISVFYYILLILLLIFFSSSKCQYIPCINAIVATAIKGGLLAFVKLLVCPGVKIALV